LEHAWPPPQVWPQPPQLVALVDGFTHAPLHSISPAPHASEQHRKPAFANE
jgi:hypothetical protein